MEYIKHVRKHRDWHGEPRFHIIHISAGTVLARLSPGSVSPLDDFEAVSGYHHFTVNMLRFLKDKV